MKRKLIFGVALLLIGIICGYFFSRTLNVSSGQMQKNYTGYLVCQSCAEGCPVLNASNIDIRKNPEKHTVSCLRMYTCVTSGYGIFMKNNDSSYTYCKFDKKGSDLAYKNIVSQTIKTDNLMVEVTGKMRDTILIVNSITEK